ncbi:hypothetical protein [Aquimarina sediminis]|uniref:hypothetical protein n=1 Tax=Aquimarina sediminis TaxID=2070536 RepID=UPI000CA05979|nr:hypothetical protein [Aquimarina sediminis]
MKFLKVLVKKMFNIQIGAYYGASAYEMNNFFCGIGESEILPSEIKISKYPFEPSYAFPERIIKAQEITAICYDSYPLLLQIKNEVIFVSREHYEPLKEFTKRNAIRTFEATKNWDWLLEPFIDTEYTEKIDKNITEILVENGITKYEIKKIRKEVEQQMLKYNFDTMLWEWRGLGLPDVLGAMRVKYNKEEFAEFYNRAMEIELRTE